MRSLLVLAALATLLSKAVQHQGEGPNTDLGTFASPASVVRPRFRYW